MIPTTTFALLRNTTSIGNFIPIVWIPLLGINQSASSGPRCLRFKSPIRRVKKLSAFRTFVASQVFLVTFMTGMSQLLSQRIREHSKNTQSRRSQNEDENGWQDEKYQRKN